MDYISSRVVSFLKVQRMVEKGCEAYLAFVRDVSADIPTVESVPVVRDFLDVFPADLPSMPPDRDIDFGIDLVPGTQPISISPYLMEPLELKDLKEQLHELLDKGFGQSFMRLDFSEPSRVLACVVFRSSLYKRIRTCQYDDPYLLVLKDTVRHVNAKEVSIGDDGVLRMQGRICVPKVDGLRELILEEDHNSRYSIHPGAAKIIYGGREDFASGIAHEGSDKVQKKGKLSTRCIGPFEILERVVEVAYKLTLPTSLSAVHLVFHVSMLPKYYGDPSHVLDFSAVQLDKDLTYVEESVAILDKQVQKLRSKNIVLVKVQWRGQPVEEETWEIEMICIVVILTFSALQIQVHLLMSDASDRTVILGDFKRCIRDFSTFYRAYDSISPVLEIMSFIGLFY
ncbi:uncharacterized protein [Nicotiana tomentosiformis]|uniref:uncharacterized protein n=1 Tax=Nicotiana tomentosiformis TaxID=4098 RepID=UPI00388CD06B